MCTILCRCGTIRTVRPYRDTRTLDGLCAVHLQEAKQRFFKPALQSHEQSPFSNVPIINKLPEAAPVQEHVKPAVVEAVAKLSVAFKKRSA